MVVLWFACWPVARVHLQAMAVLDLVANRPVPRVLRRAVMQPIRREELELSLPDGVVRARLYTPLAHPNAPAMVVLHGVHHLGIDDPRLMNFSSAMASCGLRVLTPELPDIKDYHIGANSITTIGESALWMARENGGHAVGLMGISFAGGLALLAAANPEYRHSIRFVVAVGSQDEMARVAEYYRSGRDIRPDGTVEVLPPHDYGALVLEYEHLEEFVPADDVGAMRAVLRAHLYEDAAGEKAVFARMSPQQVAEARALMNTSLPATQDALARDETQHLKDMAAVSPHRHLAELHTPVYLLHGEADNVIPAAETQWLASDLPRKTLKAVLISPVLSHVNLDGKGPTVMDRLRLLHFFALILHAAEVH
jgi:dienelactone hydrolase